MSWGIFLTYHIKRNSKAIYKVYLEIIFQKKVVEKERIKLYSLLKQWQVLTVSANKLTLLMIKKIKSEHLPKRLTILKHRHMWYLSSETKMYSRIYCIYTMRKIWNMWPQISDGVLVSQNTSMKNVLNIQLRLY